MTGFNNWKKIAIGAGLTATLAAFLGSPRGCGADWNPHPPVCEYGTELTLCKCKALGARCTCGDWDDFCCCNKDAPYGDADDCGVPAWPDQPLMASAGKQQTGTCCCTGK